MACASETTPVDAEPIAMVGAPAKEMALRRRQHQRAGNTKEARAPALRAWWGSRLVVSIGASIQGISSRGVSASRPEPRVYALAVPRALGSWRVLLVTPCSGISVGSARCPSRPAVLRNAPREWGAPRIAPNAAASAETSAQAGARRADPMSAFPRMSCVPVSRPEQSRTRAVCAAKRTLDSEDGWASIGGEGKEPPTKGVHAVVFGHTHGQVAGHQVGHVLVVQPRNWGMSAARLDFVLEDRPGGRWRVLNKQAHLLRVNAKAPADPEVVRLAQPYHEVADRAGGGAKAAGAGGAQPEGGGAVTRFFHTPAGCFARCDDSCGLKPAAARSLSLQ